MPKIVSAEERNNRLSYFRRHLANTSNSSRAGTITIRQVFDDLWRAGGVKGPLGEPLTISGLSNMVHGKTMFTLEILELCARLYKWPPYTAGEPFYSSVEPPKYKATIEPLELEVEFAGGSMKIPLLELMREWGGYVLPECSGPFGAGDAVITSGRLRPLRKSWALVKSSSGRVLQACDPMQSSENVAFLCGCIRKFSMVNELVELHPFGIAAD